MAEIVKSKRVNLIILILGFVFFFTACSFAQVERIITLDKDGNEVVTRFSSHTWNIVFDSKEYIELNVKSDSLDSKTITLDLYAYFPKSINPKGADMIITYMDGTTDLLKQSKYNPKSNYAEYSPTNGINNLVFKLVKSISIKNIAETEPSKEGDVYFKYFMSFL
jgi:hypothetical protein